MNKGDYNKNIAIVILAAGEAKRMGEPKQLLRWKGKTLVEHAINKAIGTKINDVFLVLGAHANQFKDILHLYKDVNVIYNKEWQSGIGSSIACAVNFLCMNKRKYDGILFALADQPLISEDHLYHLVRQFSDSLKPNTIVATRHKKGIGVPAIFEKSHFSTLSALKGNQGAKNIITKHTEHLESIPIDEQYFDIDTPNDYERLKTIT